MPNTSIYVMTHTAFSCPPDPCYKPLQVGKAINKDLGYLGDDTGDNISDLNPYYGELTGVYWVWKNDTASDIVGVCHYRRFFINDDWIVLGKEDYERLLSDCDILLSNAVEHEVSIREEYAVSHGADLMEKTGEVIKELYPEDYDTFEECLDSKWGYYANLCVTRKPIFDDYCSWLFNICTELAPRLDLSGKDLYHKRIFGFVSEILLMVYAKSRGLKIRDGKIGVSSEKAETTTFKLALSQLVKQRKFTEARKMYYDMQKVRPDIWLELSDLKHEMPDIEVILYILEQEAEAGTESFLALSGELSELIPIYREEYELAKAGKPAKRAISKTARKIMEQI